MWGVFHCLCSFPFLKERVTQWLKRAISPFHHHKSGTERASGDLDSIWKLPAPEPGCEDCSYFQCALSVNKFVGTLYRLCMGLMRKLFRMKLAVEAYFQI
eukprot:256354-Pelagomonas_calceolata.AAC.1